MVGLLPPAAIATARRKYRIPARRGACLGPTDATTPPPSPASTCGRHTSQGSPTSPVPPAEDARGLTDRPPADPAAYVPPLPAIPPRHALPRVAFVASGCGIPRC